MTNLRPTPVPSPSRSLPGLCLRLARNWWRSVLPLAAASAVLAMVIGGAVGVGDSIVANLVRRAESRLGGILAAVTSSTPFDALLAGRMTDASGRDAPPWDRLVPALLLPVTVESTGSPRRTVQAMLLGVDDPSTLGFGAADIRIGADGVAVNGPLARELHVAAGQAVVLRALERSAISADSPLGRRVTGSVGRRAPIAMVLPDGGLGGFSLRPSQTEEPLVVVPLATAQELARRPAAANTILAVSGRPVGGTGSAAERSERAAARLSVSLRPTLGDLGLDLEMVRDDLVRLSSDSLVLPPEADRAAEAVLGPIGGEPVMLFLANEIAVASGRNGDGRAGADGGKGDGSIPYSTVAGIGTTDLPFGRLVSPEGTLLPPPKPGEIIVDGWIADDLAAQGFPIAVGSRLSLRFFEAETLHGRAVEQSRTFVVSGIARMEGAAVERSLVPEVEGITDKRSIAAWDPPFPFDASRVRTTPPHDEDDRFWKEHGATPKAFVSIADARAVAAGRFGRTTTWHARLPASSGREQVSERIAAEIDPMKLTFLVRPVLADGLAAARGSTPFAGLFMALSSFVVVAGLALAWLLSRLLVSSRLSAVGTLAALGWAPARLAAVFGGVGAVAAAAGCLVGAAVGPAWSGVLLGLLSRGLTPVDGGASDAIFQPTAPRLLSWIGVATASFLMAAAAPWLAARRAAGLDPRLLLGGREPPVSLGRRGRWLASTLASAAVASAIAIATGGGSAEQESGRFFLAGALAVLGGSCLVRAVLEVGQVRNAFGLVRRAISMRPDRTLSVVGMVAVAEFLIVAVSSFVVRPPVDPQDHTGPTGGWTLMATLAEPCSADLADRTQLESLGLSTEQTRTLLSANVTPIRVSRGEDASCLNVQKVAVPTLFGVDRRFRERGGFRFVASRALGDAGPSPAASPWGLLDRPAGGRTGPIPAIVDEATARYALGLPGLGGRVVVSNDRGSPVEIEVVGLLAPGILQGSLIVSEEDFLDVFPSTSGARLFLAEPNVPGGDPSAVEDALQTALADFGPTVRSTIARMRALASVQNTYLAGFQALGTLGLLLGSVGVAAVQARSLLERSGEIGLFAALGFSPARIVRLVTAETVSVVGVGLAIGFLSAVVAVWPQFAAGRAFLPLGWAAASCLGTLLVAAAVGRLVAGRLAAVDPAEAIRAPE